MFLFSSLFNSPYFSNVYDFCTVHNKWWIFWVVESLHYDILLDTIDEIISMCWYTIVICLYWENDNHCILLMTTMHIQCTLFFRKVWFQSRFVNFTVFVFSFSFSVCFVLTCVLYFQNSHLTFPVINTVVNNITICVASLMDGDLMPDKGSSK